MEEFSHLGASSSRGGGGSAFLYLPSSSSSSSAAAHSAAPQPSSSPFYNHFYSPNPNPNPNSNLKAEAAPGSSHYPYGRRAPPAATSPAPGEVEAIKAKIMSHPQYSALVGAYMDCQKVGAPPAVATRLSAVAQQIESRNQTSGVRDPGSADPELDQFMEAYCDMLVKYREELTKPLEEAMDFLRRVESQLNSISNGASASLFSSADDKREVVGSSEEDQDGSGGEGELPEIDPRAEDKELKHHLMKKYSGYLSSLRHELSKKKKKGKLPKEARQKLLNWWELHYKWPYPSESEKVALAESTGLDQKQINNWFINQRKRHWKPSEDMQFVVMDAFHPQNAAAAAALYMGGPYMSDGTYRLGP